MNPWRNIAVLGGKWPILTVAAVYSFVCYQNGWNLLCSLGLAAFLDILICVAFIEFLPVRLFLSHLASFMCDNCDRERALSLINQPPSAGAFVGEFELAWKSVKTSSKTAILRAVMQILAAVALFVWLQDFLSFLGLATALDELER